MGDEPAWSSHARRIQPGESIRVNRDDDDREDGAGLDDGTADRGGGLSEKRRSSNEMATTDTTDSGTTLAGSRQYDEKAGERADVDAMERGEYTGNDGEKQGRVTNEEEQSQRDERETPILAEYREGNHLVRERLKNGEDEVSQLSNSASHESSDLSQLTIPFNSTCRFKSKSSKTISTRKSPTKSPRSGTLNLCADTRSTSCTSTSMMERSMRLVRSRTGVRSRKIRWDVSPDFSYHNGLKATS